MPIRVTCPKCHSVAACPDEYRGRTVRCKKCGQPFVAGAAAPRKAAPPPAPPPRHRLTRGRFAVAAVAAALLGACIGLPAAWLILKKPHHEHIAAGPAATTAGDNGGGPSVVPPGSERQGPPRDTGTKPPPAAVPVAWSDYTSRDWSFSARFPAEPQVVKLTSFGGKRAQMFEAGAAAAAGRKSVTVSVTCEERDPGETADAMAFLDARAAEVDREKKKRTALTLGGFPGVEVRGEADGDAWVTTHRFYVARARTYHLVASGPTDRDAVALVREFLSSFALLDQPPAEPPAPPTPGERALAWMAANLAGPTNEVIGQAKERLAGARNGSGFTLALGDGLTKSNAPVLLAGYGGELFQFELSADAARALQLGARDVRVTTFSEPGEKPAKPTLTLSDLKIAADSPKLTGTVAYRRGAELTGPLVLRLSHPSGAMLRVQRQPVDGKAVGGSFSISLPSLATDDPKLSGPVVVFVEVCQGETAVSNPVAALVTVVPGPPKGGLAELKLNVPDGWKADYNKFLGGVGGWELTKPPPTPMSEGEVLRIEPCPDDARTPADYVAHLKEKDWLNVDVPGFVEVGQKEEWPDGFIIRGVVKRFGGKTPPVLGFVAVRDINGLKVRCYSGSLRTTNKQPEGSREELVEMFKAARFGSAE
jgi:hypothetical protein